MSQGKDKQNKSNQVVHDFVNCNFSGFICFCYSFSFIIACCFVLTALFISYRMPVPPAMLRGGRGGGRGGGRSDYGKWWNYYNYYWGPRPQKNTGYNYYWNNYSWYY